jgi:hypothetical protein
MSTTRIGVGTSSPTSTFQVNGTTSLNGQFDVINGGANFRVTSESTSYVALKYNASTWASFNANDSYFQGTQFYFQSGLNFRFAGSGSFGFTGNPLARLLVKGSGSTSATTSLLVQNSSGTQLGYVDDSGQWVLGAGAVKTWFTGNYLVSLNNTTGNGLAITTINNSAYNAIAVNNDFLINGAGVVQLGRSTAGTTFNASTHQFNVGSSSNRITTTNGGGYAQGFTFAGSFGNSRTLSIGSALGQQGVYYDTNSVFGIYRGAFEDTTNPVLIASTTGNVGVGEASPTARLQVKGSGSTSATTSLLVQNSSATTTLSVNDAGTVTTGGDIFAGNIQIGKGKSTGIYNVAMGQYALAGIVGSSTSAYTTAIGQAAGGNIASGNHNVIIGAEVAQQSTGMSSSVLIGSKIFGNVTSAINNTLAIGTGNTSNYYPTIYATNINTDSPNVRIGNNSALTAAVPTAPTASAILELSSTTKGFLPPQMTTAQKNAIATPANGLMVFDTDLVRPCFFNGATWITL